MSTQEWRKCYICGEPVLWQTNGIGWHPIQYHDCKPVPGARLGQAVALLREARDHVEQVVQDHKESWGERLMHKQEPAITCLAGIDAYLAGQPAPAPPRVQAQLDAMKPFGNAQVDAFVGQPAPAPVVIGPVMPATPTFGRVDTTMFVGGPLSNMGHTISSPAPVKLNVDDAMVERARAAMWGDDDYVHPADQRTRMRAALVAALEGGK